jgi:zinc protease
MPLIDMPPAVRRPSPSATTLGAALCIAAHLWPVVPLRGQGSTRAPLASPALPGAAQAPRIPHTRFTLANGLTVVVHEDRSAPVVAVTVSYHVGSKNERPGRTGVAHLLEHLMFTGSTHAPGDSFARHLVPLGDRYNAVTTEDRTSYDAFVPSNGIETLLWLESDRMGFLLDDLDQADLDRQRDVVKNERRRSYDDRAFGTRDDVVLRALYPEAHPYSWLPIRSLADLSSVTLGDVREFFRLHYAPNNATLVIAGDVDAADVRRLVGRYFGDLPRGRSVVRPTVVPAALPAERRLVLEDARARLPQIAFTWPTVGVRHRDRPALDVVGRMLAQDQTSRLTRLLIRDRQLATTVSARHDPREEAGTFTVTVAPRPGVSLTAVERLVDSTLATLGDEPAPAAEVQRGNAYDEVSFVTTLQAVFGRAFWLADGQAFHADPEHFRAELAAWRAVAPADVQRVTRRYLGAGRVVLSMVPAGRLDLVSKPELPFQNVTAGGAIPTGR